MGNHKKSPKTDELKRRVYDLQLRKGGKMKVEKLLKTCQMCSGQLKPTHKANGRQHYKCIKCNSTVDAKIKMMTAKR